VATIPPGRPRPIPTQREKRGQAFRDMVLRVTKGLPLINLIFDKSSSHDHQDSSAKE
jgi:hypothetical protein